MADNIGPSSPLFNSTMTTKRDYIPIRSVVYRKSLESFKEAKIKKETLNVLPKFGSSINLGEFISKIVIY